MTDRDLGEFDQRDFSSPNCIITPGLSLSALTSRPHWDSKIRFLESFHSGHWHPWWARLSSMFLFLCPSLSVCLVARYSWRNHSGSTDDGKSLSESTHSSLLEEGASTTRDTPEIFIIRLCTDRTLLLFSSHWYKYLFFRLLLYISDFF